MKRDEFIITGMLNVIVKILIYAFEFINVSIMIKYLGSMLYGEWITIITIFMWVNSCDLGIGNGLRNRLTHEIAVNDNKKIHELISTSYFVMIKMAIGLAGIGCVISFALTHIGFYQRQFLIPLYVCVLGFSMNFIVNLSRSIAYSYQKSVYVTCSQLATSVMTCVGVLLLSAIGTKQNLLLFTVVYVICMILPNIFLQFILQKAYKQHYVIRHKYYSNEIVKSIASLGIKFFILQALSLILYSTDTIIIKIFLGGEEVTRYDIINKIFKAGNELFSVILISTWSAVTLAAARNDYLWIKKNLQKLVRLWGGFSVGVLLVMVIVNPIVSIWIRSAQYVFSLQARVVFAIHCIMLAWNGIFSNVSNGLGRLDVQLKSSLVAIVVNIPISIFLVKYMNMGFIGVKIGTILSLVCTIVPLTIDIVGFVDKKTNKKDSELVTKA